MAAYATAADLVGRFDSRDIAELASDTDEPVADISTDPNVSLALDDASGRIEAALLVSGQYTVDQLSSLTGNAKALLCRLTCELAMAMLVGRRPEKYSSDMFVALVQHAEDQLELLRKGVNLFNITTNVDAGLPKVDGPSAVTYQRLNLLPDRTRNYYPNRSSRLPLGRGFGGD
ncbi:MAG TPA: hypothetical protein VG713_05440 [Pirellulales bacterium]|nr:hypothetical protein [Pirellulales bacterium]